MARTWLSALRKTVAIFAIGITYVRTPKGFVGGVARLYGEMCFMRKWQIRIAKEQNVCRAGGFLRAYYSYEVRLFYYCPRNVLRRRAPCAE